MMQLKYDSSNIEKPLSKLNFYFIIILIFSNLLLIQCQGGNIKKIIIFEDTKFSSGTTNKIGDLFIEYYSEEGYYDIPNSIFFYCLSKNNRYCFSNESSYIKEINIDIDEVIDIAGFYNYYKIYDSRNLFITTRKGINSGNQYLFSINSYNSIVELHNFNNNTDKTRYIWDFKEFFNLEDDENNFPYERRLYELKGPSLYIIVFIPKTTVSEYLKDMSFIIKFTFKSFEEDPYEKLKFITFNNYINRIIIDTFFMDDRGNLVMLSCYNPGYNIRLFFTLFDQNVQSINEFNIDIANFLNNNMNNKFFRTIYLANELVMFVYYCFNCFNQWHIINFELYRVNPLNGVSKVLPTYGDPLRVYMAENFLAECIKLNDNKIVFFNYNINNNYENNKMFIKIIQLNQDYSYYNLFQFPEFHLENNIPKTPLSLFIHNGYIIFTSNAIQLEEINKPENEMNYYSILMIFGYPNGTDSTIDISEFIIDNEDNDISPFLSNQFYNFLMQNYTIVNNLGYMTVNSIKLVSIPDEINIMEIKVDNNNGNSEIKKTNNSFMTPEFIYVIKQNRDLIKTSQYYYIDYQYMDRSPEDQQIYYGRINRLKFKLCHDYCGTCNELSKSDTEQKCLSCLSEYQYDYLYFQKINNNVLLNCVPENYYLDGNNMIQCDIENTKYYINITNNKKICFPDDKDCPLSYPLYNETEKECYKCDFEHFKRGECTADNLAMDSCVECNYECYKIGGCNFNNFDTTSDDFYERVINGGFLSNYSVEDDSELIVNNGDGYAFQIITVKNELNNLKENTQRNFSVIDLKDCIDLLRDKNNLDPNEDLILVKYENNNQVSNGNKKSIQYEVHLQNNTKLDLSICDDTNINIYIPIELDEKTQKLYESMEEQGYNLQDINDKFYQDVCTLYKSIDGTDVCLLDRKNIYEQNKWQCQDNCEVSEYLPENKYLKCDCNIINKEKIDTKDPLKITHKKLSKIISNIETNSQVLKCYNLVFRKVTIKENVGSILSNIYLIGFLISFAIFCYNKAEYLKTEIDELLQSQENINENNSIILNKEKNEQKVNDKEIIIVNKKKKEPINTKKNATNKLDIEYKEYSKYFNYYVKGEKYDKNKRKIIIKNITNKENLSDNKNLSSKESKENSVKKLNMLDENQQNIILQDISDKGSNKTESEISEEKDITDYELNHLEFEEAIKLDKRNFLNIYWYLLKREHIILATFINRNDYNFFSIKLSKIFFELSSDMAFNVFLFSDESMHNIYTSGSKVHGWTDQFAQMVYATIITQIFQIIINYLTMTDIHYYQLKKLKNENKLNNQNVLAIKKCIKIKIIVYFFSAFVLLLFFWYSASAFCANTQGIFIGDSYTSFLMGLLYPFILYLIPTALRYISLKAKEKKNLKILYSLSDKIPFF